jgi:RNA polymerase sigma-70 factor (ECF subfamily)
MLTFNLIALDTDNERDKFNLFYTQNKQLLTSIARKLLLSEELADDAVHTTFLKAMEHKEEIFRMSAIDFRRWSVVVLKNNCADIRRKRKNIDTAVQLDADWVEEIENSQESVEEIMIHKETYASMMVALAQLDPLNREIFQMKYILGMPYAEICKIHRLTIEQLSCRMERTRRKIRTLLKGVCENHEK